MVTPNFLNNGYSTLAEDLTVGETDITIQTGHGARFPATNFWCVCVGRRVRLLLRGLMVTVSIWLLLILFLIGCMKR